MKEASGELNATVVVVMAVTVLIAFFYYTLWPILKKNFETTASCNKSICDSSTIDDGYITCYPKGHYREAGYEIQCVYKG